SCNGTTEQHVRRSPSASTAFTTSQHHPHHQHCEYCDASVGIHGFTSTIPIAHAYARCDRCQSSSLIATSNDCVESIARRTPTRQSDRCQFRVQSDASCSSGTVCSAQYAACTASAQRNGSGTTYGTTIISQYTQHTHRSSQRQRQRQRRSICCRYPH